MLNMQGQFAAFGRRTRHCVARRCAGQYEFLYNDLLFIFETVN